MGTNHEQNVGPKSFDTVPLIKKSSRCLFLTVYILKIIIKYVLPSLGTILHTITPLIITDPAQQELPISQSTPRL